MGAFSTDTGILYHTDESNALPVSKAGTAAIISSIGDVDELRERILVMERNTLTIEVGRSHGARTFMISGRSGYSKLT